LSQGHLVCRNLCHIGTLIEVIRYCPHRSKVGRSSQGKCTCPPIPAGNAKNKPPHQPFGIILNDARSIPWLPWYIQYSPPIGDGSSSSRYRPTIIHCLFRVPP
jgi:hypothetical protein